MHRPLAILTAAAALAAAFALWAPTLPGSDSDLPMLPPATRAGETTLYGHIRSLKRTQGRFELRFDPALLVTGLTAHRAKLEDSGETDVPNDYYIREEGHRLLTYIVPARVRASVLGRDVETLTIPVSELAQIVAGKNPKHRWLLDAENRLRYWIRTYGDTVRSLDQQYQP